MTSSTIPFTPVPDMRDHAPELARRLGVILLGLAGLVAWRFLKNPRMVGIIVPLWRRLTHIAGRFERVVVRPAKVRAARTGRSAGGKTQTASLPNGRGWLVREIGWEAAGYGSHLAHLLAGPEMQALIAAVPGVGRVLRPVCRMLGFELTQVTMMVPPEVLEARIIPSPPPNSAAAEATPAVHAVAAPDDAADLVEVSGDWLGFATSG